VILFTSALTILANMRRLALWAFHDDHLYSSLHYATPNFIVEVNRIRV
jgi:hypothetical protein